MLLAIPLAALLAHQATAQTVYNDRPPANDSATEPYWPWYPEGTSRNDFMMQETSGEADLKGESRIAQWIVSASNVFRAQFGNQPVTWNETAARVAQRHVDTCRWEHWGSDNLAQLSFSEAEHRFDVNPMLEMWAEEWDYYPFRHPEAQAYSHFTAMLWNSSNTLGCAWNVRCANMTGFSSMTFFVCNYWPQGNVGTQPPGTLYAENVPRWAKWTDEQVPDVPFTAPPGGGSFTPPTRTRTVGGMGSPRGAAATGATSAAAKPSSDPTLMGGAERIALHVGVLLAGVAAALAL